MENRRIPNKLRSYRRRYGYSRKKIARTLGYSDTTTLSRWENGRAFPGLLQMFQLARMYHTEPHELYDEIWNDYEQFERLLIIEDLL
jgi:transcriptional regulator with XRE-family HTH domain